MLSIIGTIGLMICIIILGKNHKKIKWTSYSIIIIVTILQVIITLFVIYTLKAPDLKL